MKININSWFSKANKLRFLQANKFKLADTCKSIKEACNWRDTDFPVQVTDKELVLLVKKYTYLEFRRILLLWKR